MDKKSMFQRARFWLTGLLLLLLSALQPVIAQKSWSLQDCIEYAMANNIQIKQQKLGLEMEADNLLQSKLSLLPSANGNLSHAYNYGRTVDRFTNTFATQEVQSNNFYLSGQMTLFNGFQLMNTIARNKLNLQASRYDVEKMQNDISLNLASAYLNILYNEEAVGIADKQLELTRQQLVRVGKLVDAGSLARGALLNIEAQAANEELQLVNANNNLALAYLSLVQILDLKSVEGFSIQKPVFSLPDQFPLLERPDQVFNVAQGIQPEVKSAEIKVESAMKDLRIARGLASPVLSLSGAYGTGFSGASQRLKSISYSGYDTIGFTAQSPAIPVLSPTVTAEYEKIPFSDQINDNLNKSFGFYLSVPLFNGWQTRTNISRAKIGIESARYNLETSRNQLYQDVQRAYADALAAVKKYQASKKSLDAMKEAYFYTEQKFNLGSANSVDFNEAKKNLANAEAELLTAKYEYVFKRTVIDFYLGRPIDIK